MMFPENEKVHGNGQNSRRSFTSTDHPRTSDNLCEILAKIGEDDSSDRGLGTQARRPQEHNQDDTNDKGSDYIIEDDPLRDQCEAISWLQELDIGCSLVKRWFEKARDDEMPIVVAATLTSTLVHHFLATDSVHNPKKRIGSCGEVLNLFFERQKQDAKDGGCVHSTGGGHENEAHGDHKGPPCYKFRKGIPLIIFSRSLKDFILRKQQPGFLSSIEQKPIHSYFLTPAEDAEREHTCSLGAVCSKLDYEGCISIFKTLWNIHFTGPQNSCVVPTEMFVDFVENYEPCGTPDCPCNLMQTSFAWYVQVILESAKSFIWKNGKPNPINCRIQALRLSQEILASVEVVQAIDTKDSFTFGPNMHWQCQALRNMVQKILETSLFDLLHQSPLIAGRQSSNLLQCALFNALPLMDQTGMFGTVLYFYKVCQFATSSEQPIPVLDNLCTIFRQSVFMGEFPTKNFELFYVRFMKMPRKAAKDSGRKGGRVHGELDWDKSYWLQEGHQDRILQSNISCWFDLNSEEKSSMASSGLVWRVLTRGSDCQRVRSFR